MNTFEKTLSGAMVGLTALTIGTPALVAQEPGSVSMEATVEHAQIGRLVSVDDELHRIVIVPQTNAVSRLAELTPTNRVFRVDRLTPVRGLGAVVQVGGITPDQDGGLVRITYQLSGDRGVARRVDFLPTTQIRLTTGTVSNVNPRAATFDLTDPAGRLRRMRMDVGPGGVVDSASGLLPLSRLHDGQRVEVYYAAHPGRSVDSGVAYLVVRTDHPAPMVEKMRSVG